MEIETKTERLIRILENEDLKGVLLNAQHNFAWLTGGRSNGVNLSIENGGCFLLIRRDGKRFVIANNIEMPRLLAEEICDIDFEPVIVAWEQEKADGGLILRTAQDIADGELASDLSFGVRSVENLIARARYALLPEEIARYKMLGADTAAVFEKIISALKGGESENEIAAAFRAEFAKLNILPVGLMVAADERIDNFRHPIPTDKRWNKRLLLVACARREGLITNISRMIAVGAAEAGIEKKYNAVKSVYADLLTNTVAGRSGKDLFETAANAYRSNDFAAEIKLHHQGGACGYKTRDWVAHPACGEIVVEDQAFAWNPSITGTKIEDTVLLGKNGLEVLTTTPNLASQNFEINGKIVPVAEIVQF